MTPERHKILLTLDVEAVRAEFIRMVGEPIIEPGKGDPILASLHKARLGAGHMYFNRKTLQLSRTWLATNGYKPDSWING